MSLITDSEEILIYNELLALFTEKRPGEARNKGSDTGLNKNKYIEIQLIKTFLHSHTCFF